MGILGPVVSLMFVDDPRILDISMYSTYDPSMFTNVSGIEWMR